MAIDRLSALPDSLLIHTLSFLEMKEAAITSLLSKRWQFLWTELPRLVFRENSEKISKFVARVHRTLVICSRTNLKTFIVVFKYNKCFACDVNVWIEFAVKNKVKEVCLKLNSEKDIHMLPQIMYSNPSLTLLVLYRCIMAPRRTIEWQSLTVLYLSKVQLGQHVIEKILSSCPVLRDVYLMECGGFNCLEFNSPSLYNLLVDNSEPLLKISAPYIRCLISRLYPEERKLCLANTQSLVRAYIDFFRDDWNSKSEEMMSYVNVLLENTQHVKELKLGSKFFEVVAMLVVNGWQLPQSTRRCLIISEISCKEHNISGIVGLLKSSPNLETLVIKNNDSSRAKDFINWGSTSRDDLDCDLLNLKTVKIRNFTEPSLGSDPMLTLARILLKRAIVLEEMVIEIDLKDIGDFVKISQTLLTYPRSSQKAVVALRQQSCSVAPRRSLTDPAYTFGLFYDGL